MSAATGPGGPVGLAAAAVVPADLVPADLPGRVRTLLRAARAVDPRRAPRVVVGLAGKPGSGKSTTAAALVAELVASGARSALLPMDGFHLAGSELVRLGRADRKGAPDTFDADGFVHLLLRLRSPEARTSAVYAPRFDRELEEPVAGAIAITPDTEVVVVEGNYLLLDAPPWTRVRALLEETWYLEVDDALRVERLVARHERHGRTPADARAWTLGPDQANADLVAGSRGRADGTVHGR